MDFYANPFVRIPWDDVLFELVLPHLTLKDLFSLRGLSRACNSLVDMYLKTIREVNLALYHEQFTPLAFEVLSRNCTQLRKVVFSRCIWLTDSLVKPLFQSNPHIIHLNLYHCTGLTSSSLQPIIIQCKNLEHLNLAGCYWLSTGCLQAMTLHLRKITHLDLSSCILLDNVESLNTFLQVSSGLKVLNLSNLPCVTDRTLEVISIYCQELEHLNLQGCYQITDEGVCIVAEYCEHLKSILVLNCPGVHMENVGDLFAGIYVDRPVNQLFVNAGLDWLFDFD